MIIKNNVASLTVTFDMLPFFESFSIEGLRTVSEACREIN